MVNVPRFLLVNVPRFLLVNVPRFLPGIFLSLQTPAHSRKLQNGETGYCCCNTRSAANRSSSVSTPMVAKVVCST